METKVVKHRLTQEQHDAIFELHEKGISVSKISEKFKVSRPTIYTILEKVRKEIKNEFYVKKEEEDKDMSDLIVHQKNTTVNFLGVTIDTENGSSDPRVNKALNKSFHLLDIIEFIKVTKFKLNMTMFDYFWQVVVGNHREIL